MKNPQRLVALALAASAAASVALLDACSIDDRCIRASDCTSGLACVAGSCVAPIPTADASAVDSGAGGRDAALGADAGADAGATASDGGESADATASDGGESADATATDAAASAPSDANAPTDAASTD